MNQVLRDAKLDGRLAAALLSLPTQSYLSEMFCVSGGSAAKRGRANPIHAYLSVRWLKSALAAALRPTLTKRYLHISDQLKRVAPGPEAMAMRALQSVLLDYLVTSHYYGLSPALTQVSLLSALFGLSPFLISFLLLACDRVSRSASLC